MRGAGTLVLPTLPCLDQAGEHRCFPTEDAPIQSKDLTKEPAEALFRGIGPSLRYLGRLRTRMEKKSFSQDDPLYVLVSKAYDTVHHLSVHVHYLASDAGSRERE